MQDINEAIRLSIEEKLKDLESKPHLTNFSALFRKNFDAFEKVLNFYKENTRYKKATKESGVNEIRRIMLEARVISSAEEISNGTIVELMHRIRKERNQSKKVVKENSNFHSSGVDLAHLDSVTPTPAKGVTPILEEGHKRDWLDATWLDEEPNWKEWLVNKEYPESGVWSDTWENMWRHLLKKGEERGFTEHQMTTSDGFKQLGGSFSELWLRLNKNRRQLKDKYGWEPYKVGKG